jgi:hypothetical protein
LSWVQRADERRRAELKVIGDGYIVDTGAWIVSSH